MRSSHHAHRGIASEAFLHSFLHGKYWQMARLVRSAFQVIRATRLSLADIHPTCDVLQGDPHHQTWEFLSENGQLVAPCLMYPGTYRVAIQASSDNLTGLRIVSIPVDASTSPTLLATIPLKGEYRGELLAHLTDTSLGVVIRPLDKPGNFRLDQLEISKSSSLATRWNRLWGRTPANSTGSLSPLPSPPPPTRIVYVLLAAGQCGGIRVIMEHVSRLASRGWDVQLWHVHNEASWFGRPLPIRRFATVEDMQAALDNFRGIKVATWYETAPWVARSLRANDRGFYMIQDIEESYAVIPDSPLTSSP